jgi:hypothetical protein
VLLLLTIPALALVCSLLLLVWGISSQGLDVKTASYTWTVLDQREHRAATVEKRTLFAGLPRAAGLRPSAGTSCYDVSGPDGPGGPEQRRGAPPPGTGGAVRVDETDGLLLAGRFLPARREITQVILSERAARGRLEVRREGDAFVVHNGLEEPLADLVLRDARGDYHVRREELAPGASAQLAAEPERAASELAERQLLRQAGELWPLVPATWTARLARNAFGDDCGLETRETFGRHFVLGVLDLEDEAWRGAPSPPRRARPCSRSAASASASAR